MMGTTLEVRDSSVPLIDSKWLSIWDAGHVPEPWPPSRQPAADHVADHPYVIATMTVEKSMQIADRSACCSPQRAAGIPA